MSVENQLEQTPNQQQLWNIISCQEPYHHLVALPDEICALIIPIALANQGGGYWAIKAQAMLKKIAVMPREEIIRVHGQNKATFTVGKAPNGVELY